MEFWAWLRTLGLEIWAMEEYESEHYVIHYWKGSAAEREIQEIAEGREKRYRYICDQLKVEMDRPIQYYFFDTREEVGRIIGNNPVDGLAMPPDKVFAVYNEKEKCVGFHEDVHAISFRINLPDSLAVMEGLAMYFGVCWQGFDKKMWSAYFVKKGLLPDIGKMLADNKYFKSLESHYTYPVMGTLTDWLVTVYGMDRFVELYRYKDAVQGVREVYGLSAEVLAGRFAEYCGSLKMHDGLEEMMDQKVASWG